MLFKRKDKNQNANNQNNNSQEQNVNQVDSYNVNPDQQYDYSSQNVEFDQDNYYTNEMDQGFSLYQNNQNDFSNSYLNQEEPKVFYQNGVIHMADSNQFSPSYFNTNDNQNYLPKSGLQNVQPSSLDIPYYAPSPVNKKEPLYKVRNLCFKGESDNKFYKTLTLYNINLDIYSGDRIVFLSDNGASENLFLDLLKNNEEKSDGYIFASKKDSAIWKDVYEDQEVNIEYKNTNINNLLDINYELIISFKNSLELILNKVISKFEVNINSDELTKFLDFFCFSDKNKLNFFQLSISEQNRFILLLDILVGKRIIYMNNVSLDLALKEKIFFYRFLTNYLNNRDNVLFLITNDITELKILCNRAVVFSHGGKREDSYFQEILKHYDSLDDFVILNLK